MDNIALYEHNISVLSDRI